MIRIPPRAADAEGWTPGIQNMESKPEIIRTAFCPHCSNIAPQRLLYTYTFEETRPYDKSFDFKPGEGPIHRYFLAACSTCKDVLLYISAYNPCEPEDFHKCEVLYPQGVTLDDSVPATV
jgi:hypothetical protein